MKHQLEKGQATNFQEHLYTAGTCSAYITKVSSQVMNLVISQRNGVMTSVAMMTETFKKQKRNLSYVHIQNKLFSLNFKWENVLRFTFFITIVYRQA